MNGYSFYPIYSYIFTQYITLRSPVTYSYPHDYTSSLCHLPTSFISFSAISSNEIIEMTWIHQNIRFSIINKSFICYTQFLNHSPISIHLISFQFSFLLWINQTNWFASKIISILCIICSFGCLGASVSRTWRQRQRQSPHTCSSLKPPRYTKLRWEAIRISYMPMPNSMAWCSPRLNSVCSRIP